MKFLFLAFVLILNFVISWANASYAGQYWTESKKIGGSFRTYIWVGYIMSIAGFTMVYGYILLLLTPIILQLNEVKYETIMLFKQLATDLIYLFTVVTVLPTGFYIWIRSLKKFWERKTLSSCVTAGWNTYAQIHNTMSATRNAPSAFGRVVEALFGGKGRKKKKDNTIIVICAILVLILAICGGYFTASAIMKKADREYDMFEDLRRRYPQTS